MTKFWRVIAHEYGRHVLNRRFIFALLSVPLLVAVMALVGFLAYKSETDFRPVGYIDRSGLLANPILPETDHAIEFKPFPDENQARQALDSGAIQMYYVLEADYRETGNARLVSLDQPKGDGQEQFRDFVRANLLAGQPEAVVKRVYEGDNLVLRAPEGGREINEDGWVNIILPFVAGFAFMIALFSSSGYLMQAVVEEKENRTMEVLVTSVSPAQLIAGKTIGIIGVGLTQLAAWALFGWVFILVGRTQFDWLKDLTLPLDLTLWMVATMFPAFVMVSALMAAIGATVTEVREGQQVTGLFTLPVVVPYWLIVPIMNSPNGAIATALSFFPLTAPITVTIRMGISQVPTLELLGIILILVLCALGSLWLAGKAFRLGMLQYGQRLSLKQLFGKAG